MLEVGPYKEAGMWFILGWLSFILIVGGINDLDTAHPHPSAWAALIVGCLLGVGAFIAWLIDPDD